MPAVDWLLPVLKGVGTKWISIKVADGVWKYNQVDGSNKKLKEFLRAVSDAGIEVGGWHWVYPESPGKQGDLAVVLCRELGLKHYLLDVEYNWKKSGLGRSANKLLDKLHDGMEAVDVGFCSYRFPNYHRAVPYREFLDHENMELIVPQLYWLLAHNPAKQIRRSLAEYRKISDKPFIPIGCTFPWGNWEPSVEELKEFVKEAVSSELKAYGFYSLDKIVEGKRYDWLDAIAGSVQTEPGNKIRIKVDRLNIRNSPKIADATDIGNLHKGAVMNVLEKLDPNWYRVEGYVWVRGTERLNG
ncbi:MAG TPA: SH3 domain-containing protein [Marinobacter sp.]|uniref:Uncharacterized protein n=1 Tax=marine sediment metagenome TaxID=412755 RepID=A0A0F9QGI3_9ZZZZ|nr:SH3 domain-containing protein [Marinobacter sp.]HEC61444.1 SH3 domain-containing protein [bacterium]